MSLFSEETSLINPKSNTQCTSVDSENEEQRTPRQKNCDNIFDGGDKPWQTLVSYVDELTVGGRRNSKGQYADGMGNFPGFGKKKPPRVAPDCFPSNFYERWVTNDIKIKTLLIEIALRQLINQK